MKTKKISGRLLLSALASIAVLSGCSSVEPLLQEDHGSLIQKQWNAPVAQSLTVQTNANWWKAWENDELIALIELAQKNNTDVRQALANVRSAAAQADLATANLFPSLGLSGQGTHSRQNHSSSDRWSAQGDGTWSFSLIGGNLAERRAALYEAQSSVMTLEDVRIAIASEVAQNYIQLKLAYVKREIAQQTLSNYVEASHIAGWRYEAGLVDQTDVDQSSSNVESARAQIPVIEASIQRYVNALARLTVQNAADVKVKATAEVPIAPAGISISFPAQTLNQRPDLRAAEMQLLAAAERVYVANAQRFPTLRLSGNLGTQAATLSALGASGTGVAALVGALSMPLFNWAEQVTSTEVAKAQLEKAQVAYTAKLVSALEETENALNGIASAQTRTASLALARKAAESAADLALQQYRAGLVDYQNVLNTQRSLFSARDAEQVNNADLATQLVVLYRAVGGGWTPDDTNQIDTSKKE